MVGCVCCFWVFEANFCAGFGAAGFEIPDGRVSVFCGFCFLEDAPPSFKRLFLPISLRVVVEDYIVLSPWDIVDAGLDENNS